MKKVITIIIVVAFTINSAVAYASPVKDALRPVATAADNKKLTTKLDYENIAKAIFELKKNGQRLSRKAIAEKVSLPVSRVTKLLKEDSANIAITDFLVEAHSLAAEAEKAPSSELKRLYGEIFIKCTAAFAMFDYVKDVPEWQYETCMSLMERASDIIHDNGVKKDKELNLNNTSQMDEQRMEELETRIYELQSIVEKYPGYALEECETLTELLDDIRENDYDQDYVDSLESIEDDIKAIRNIAEGLLEASDVKSSSSGINNLFKNIATGSVLGLVLLFSSGFSAGSLILSIIGMSIFLPAIIYPIYRKIKARQTYRHRNFVLHDGHYWNSDEVAGRINSKLFEIGYQMFQKASPALEQEILSKLDWRQLFSGTELPDSLYALFLLTPAESKIAILDKLPWGKRTNITSLSEEYRSSKSRIQAFDEPIIRSLLNGNWGYHRFRGDIRIEFGRKSIDPAEEDPLFLKIENTPEGELKFELRAENKNTRLAITGLEYGKEYIIENIGADIPAESTRIPLENLIGQDYDAGPFCFSVVVEKNLFKKEHIFTIADYEITESSNLINRGIRVSTHIYGFEFISGSRVNSPAQKEIRGRVIRMRSGKEFRPAKESLEGKLNNDWINEVVENEIREEKASAERIELVNELLDKHGLSDSIDPKLQLKLAEVYLAIFLTPDQLDDFLKQLVSLGTESHMLEFLIQKAILNYYQDNVMEFLIGIKSGTETEKKEVNDLFIKFISIYEFNRINSLEDSALVRSRKKLIQGGVLFNIRAKRLFKDKKRSLGSELRSDVATSDFMRMVFMNRMRENFLPALELLIEMWAEYQDASEDQKSYIKDSFFPLLQESENMSGFAEAIIETALRARRKEVYFYNLDDNETTRFMDALKDIIKFLSRDSQGLYKELEIAAANIADDDRDLSVELLEVLFACKEEFRKDFSRTQRLTKVLSKSDVPHVTSFLDKTSSAGTVKRKEGSVFGNILVGISGISLIVLGAVPYIFSNSAFAKTISKPAVFAGISLAIFGFVLLINHIKNSNMKREIITQKRNSEKEIDGLREELAKQDQSLANMLIHQINNQRTRVVSLFLDQNLNLQQTVFASDKLKEQAKRWFEQAILEDPEISKSGRNLNLSQAEVILKHKLVSSDDATNLIEEEVDDSFQVRIDRAMEDEKMPPYLIEVFPDGEEGPVLQVRIDGEDDTIVNPAIIEYEKEYYIGRAPGSNLNTDAIDASQLIKINGASGSVSALHCSIQIDERGQEGEKERWALVKDYSANGTWIEYMPVIRHRFEGLAAKNKRKIRVVPKRIRVKTSSAGLRDLSASLKIYPQEPIDNENQPNSSTLPIGKYEQVSAKIASAA